MPMKRTLFIAAGALLFTAIAFAIGSLATNGYSDHFAKSDDDINLSVGVFLALWPVFAVLGAYLGSKLWKRSQLSST
jgi:hypothetical protein